MPLQNTKKVGTDPKVCPYLLMSVRYFQMTGFLCTFKFQFFGVSLWLIIFHIINPNAVFAEETFAASIRGYTGILIQDTLHTLTAPARWERNDWLDFSLCTVGIGAVMAFDESISDEVKESRTESADDFARFIQEFGSLPSFGIMGGFYGAGMIFKNDKARSVAKDAFASSVISAGIITPTMKLAVGRSRPYQDKGAYHFEPFGGDKSFPSGHTTQAFSLASVIAEHYDVRWVDITSYGIATLVGFARIEQEAHFPSDVVAGAIIGTVVGKTVVRYNKGLHNSVTFTPYGDGREMGVILRGEF